MHAHPKTDSITTSSRVSAWLSIACAIHCALMPLAITTLPLLGLEFLASHWMEALLLGLGLGFGGYGILRGYFQRHHEPLTLVLLGVGAALVVAGLFFAPESLEHVLIPVGAITVGIAQILNIRYSKTCVDC